jgi:uncharacterized phage protein gp47/JayE
MASLSTLAFTDLVRGMAAAVQAGATQLLNLTVGSVLRAILEAIAGVVLWLQGLIAYVLTLTRFATSSGSDADSWAADFGFTRLGAVAASGQVTFTRFTDTAQSVVPFGAILQTGDGTQIFTVDTDPTNSAYNAGLGGYVLPIGTPALTVEVTAQTAGSAGNVLANSITSMGQGIPGVDTVTNAAAFTTGVDAETDQAFKARFVVYIASLSKATLESVESAVIDVQQGLQYTITENFDYDGTYDPGYFYVVIDDGSGTPPSQLLTNVGNAIEAVRGLGIRFGVFDPTVTTADVTMIISSAAGYNHSSVVGAVGLALAAFINGLGLGNGLPYTQLAAVAYGVAGVTNVTGVLLNSGTSDIAGDVKATIKSGTISVS